MKKLVLIVSGKLTVGGAEYVCRNIGYNADSNQFQIDYLVFDEEIGVYEKELCEKQCKIYHVPSPQNDYMLFYQNLKKMISENKYDVVHCHTMFNSGLVLHAAKCCGVPVRIAHSHSIRGPEYRGIVKSAYEKAMRQLILRDATHLIGCGQAAGEWLFGKKAFQKKGLVLLNGIDLDRFRYNPQTRDRIRRENHWEDCFLIGHVGHLASVKNQAFLLRLMPALLEKKPNAHLLLLGEGSDRPMLESLIQELHLERAVTMPGNVTNVNDYLSAMDVFAFPSLYEGMPLSILEVQANGLSCLISDRVPKDVFLTDLLKPLPLEAPLQWLEQLLTVERLAPEQYLLKMQNTSADFRQMLKKLYQIYQNETIG